MMTFPDVKLPGEGLNRSEVTLKDGNKIKCDLVEESGRTVLHEAAINGDEITLHVLLSGGAVADRNSKDHKHGNTPLHEAAWREYSRCVKALCVLPQPKNNKRIKESKINPFETECTPCVQWIFEPK